MMFSSAALRTMSSRSASELTRTSFRSQGCGRRRPRRCGTQGHFGPARVVALALEALQRHLHVRQIVFVGVFSGEGGSLHLGMSRASDSWRTACRGADTRGRAEGSVGDRCHRERTRPRPGSTSMRPRSTSERSASRTMGRDSEVQCQLPFGREPTPRCELTGQHPVRQCCGDRITGPHGENHDSIVFADSVEGSVA